VAIAAKAVMQLIRVMGSLREEPLLRDALGHGDRPGIVTFHRDFLAAYRRDPDIAATRYGEEN
jgi:hypothetical protein